MGLVSVKIAVCTLIFRTFLFQVNQSVYSDNNYTQIYRAVLIKHKAALIMHRLSVHNVNAYFTGSGQMTCKANQRQAVDFYGIFQSTLKYME